MPHIGGKPHPRAGLRQDFGPTISAGELGRFLGPRASTLLPTLTQAGQPREEIAAQLSGQVPQLRAVGGGPLPSGALEFGQRPVEGVTQQDITRFEDLFLTQQQSGTIGTLAKTALGRGLRGAAVQSVVQRATSQFLAENRVRGQTVLQSASERALQRFRDLAAGGLGVLGRFTGGARGLGAIGFAQAGSASPEAFQQLAEPLIKSLVGLGQQRAVEAGLLLDTGVDLRAFGLSEQESNLARAVQQFLNPSITQAQRQRIFQETPLRSAADLPGLQRRELAGFEAVAGRRQSAAQFLAQQLQSPVTQFQQAVERIQTQGPALATFLAGRFLGGAEEITGMDTGQLQPIFNVLQGQFAPTGGTFR